MPDVLNTAHQWLEQGREVALATVVETWRSAPVGVGGLLVADVDGNFEGSVSGGCVEAEIIARAGDVVSTGKPELLAFGVADETAWNVGLPCGGNIRVLIVRLSGPKSLAALDAIRNAGEGREAIVVETRLDDGAMNPIRQPEAARRGGEVKAALDSGASTLTRSAFLHACLPAPRVLIVGATHIGQILVRLASDAQFDTVIVDPRETFASASRFGNARLVVGWPSETLADLRLDDRTAVVTLAHHAEIDDQALEAALRSPVFYVGALGSRRTHAKRIDRLAKAGIRGDEISRIHAPVGLDIGADSPGEIAVSIMAQIIAEFRKGSRATG